MMRSLFAGVSGLKTHQTKMDVIGNNIANVNTVAYKSQSATFQDLMYQTTQSASGANAATGRAGINAKQIGLGVRNGAINTNITTAGASQSTGNPFDIQLNGDAFFIVNDGQTNFFTRAGTFNIDGNGTLCMTTNGYAVMGWQADDEGNIIKNSVSQLRVMSADVLVQDPQATTDAYMTGTIDKKDSQLEDGQVSTIQVYDAKGYSYTVKFSITNTKDDGTFLDEGQYRVVVSDLLDDRGKSVLTYDATGTGDPGNYDELTADEKRLYLAGKNLLDGAGTMMFYYNTTNGKWGGLTSATSAEENFTLNLTELADLNNAFTKDIKVDMTTTKNIDNNGISTICGKTGNVTNTAIGAGRAAGEMDSLSVGQDGKIVATYTNGVTKILGQIAVATFANAAGLEKAGDNLYSATQNSGAFDGIGVDITSAAGSMTSGVLEMSNVDLSSEFTEMITTQRGFQANSRIITVSDTMLEELINLKR